MALPVGLDRVGLKAHAVIGDGKGHGGGREPHCHFRPAGLSMGADVLQRLLHDAVDADLGIGR